MKAYFYESDGDIVVKARAEGDGAVGDMTEIVTEGRDFAGVPYAELAAVGSGEIDIDNDTGEGRIVGRGAVDRAFAEPRRPRFRVAARKAATAGHEGAVRRYRSGGHRAINESLRGHGVPGHGSDIHDQIAVLREAIDRGEVTASGLVYRAVKDAAPDIDDVDAKWGHVIEWKGFTSATHDEAVARSHLGAKGTLFRIMLPQGSHALEYAQISGAEDPEGEVILPAGARFAVREASTTGGITMIDLVMFKRGPHDRTDGDTN